MRWRLATGKKGRLHLMLDGEFACGREHLYQPEDGVDNSSFSYLASAIPEDQFIPDQDRIQRLMGRRVGNFKS